MISVRKSDGRGRTKLGWLDSRHSFSFGHYHDPENVGFGPLRVINEDRVTPGAGFGRHSHDNMEILSYVLEGALAHEDSLGTGSTIRPGDVQRMSAGTGIQHAEFNASKTEPVHFLQIWIIPEQRGLQPSYEQKAFAPDARMDQLRLIGSRDGRDGSVTIHQDVSLYLARLEAGNGLSHPLRNGRRVWLQVTSGAFDVNGAQLEAGDGAAIEHETDLRMSAGAAGELLLFDLN